MTALLRSIATIGFALLMQAGMRAAEAQTPRAASPDRRVSENTVREKLNAWTVGLAGGLLEGAPIRFAVEMARVVDSGDDLHVLPIVTRGPSENVEALLYLRGVDAAILNTDALEQFRTLVPDIQRRITFILSLFPSEVHVFVRPEIAALSDLAGKRVNFNTPGTAAAYSGPLLFDRLGLKVEQTFIPHQTALEQMRSGSMAAAVFITSKPVDAFAKGNWSGGFKFLPLDFSETFADYYVPSSLTAADYPTLIAGGEAVRTIAVPTFLAAYNWPAGSHRRARLGRFISVLFERIERLQQPGFHPKWRDVNLAAGVPGLARAPAAQEWLDRPDAVGPAASGGVAPPSRPRPTPRPVTSRRETTGSAPR